MNPGSKSLISQGAWKPQKPEPKAKGSLRQKVAKKPLGR